MRRKTAGAGAAAADPAHDEEIAPMSQNPPPPPPQDGIYRVLQVVFAADIVLGVFLMAAGGRLAPHMPGLPLVGAVLALVGAVLLLFFRRLAGRAGKRRRP